MNERNRDFLRRPIGLETSWARGLAFVTDRGRPIVCAGNLHYDIVVEAPRLPRLGETLPGRSWHRKFGGKAGNQAVAAARCGANVRFVGAIGDDSFGEFLKHSLAAEGVDCSRLHTAKSGSGMSVAVSVVGGDYGAVTVSGANAELPPDAIDAPEIWSGAAWLMLQNEWPTELNARAAAVARDRGISVCLNAAPVRALDQCLADSLNLIVVNSLEAGQLLGWSVEGRADAERAAAELAERFPRAVVTAGKWGAGAACRNSGSFAIAAPEVRDGSAHGAGDAFVGILCALDSFGVEFRESVERACIAASRHVEASVPKVG